MTREYLCEVSFKGPVALNYARYPYNEELISSTKFLTTQSEMFQFLGCNGAPQSAQLPITTDPNNGIIFVIVNATDPIDGYSLEVQLPDGSPLTVLMPDQSVQVFSTFLDWHVIREG